MDLVQALSFCRDVPSVMAVVRMAARALSGADGVTFVLRDGELCHYADEDAIGPLWKGRRFPLSTCISGWVMLNRQPAVIPDIYRDDRIPHDAYRPTFVKSLVMVPVRTDEPVAAIGAYWATVRMPKAEEVALLQAVAHSTAVALTNVQLYESLRAAVAESQARAEEAERANRAKSVFLAAISHDLRQPLQTMRLYHNMLNERAANGRATTATAAGGGGGSSPAPANGLANALDRKLIGGMGEALSAGEELLRALLDVSVLDAGTVAANPQRFGLEATLAGLVSAVRGDAEKAGVEIRLRNAAKTGPQAALEEADTDPVLLKCILRNLLTNAIRYTGRGGRVLVSTRRRGRSMLVQVWDTGVGISADQLDTVFEDFVQLGNPERDRTKGLGLGLGIVRRMARLLGTTVTVRSVPGRGSVFSVLVPCVPTAPAVGAPATATPDSLVAFPRDGQRPAQRERDPRTILAVEDDALQRMALGAIIESWGYRVITAAGSDDAMAAVRDAVRLPGLVISDFRLPGPLNGVQLVARLGNEVRRHLPGIIVTGDTDPARIQEASATGCVLIHKPYLPEVLRAAIEEAMRGGDEGGARSDGQVGALDA
ncbi:MULTISPECIES: hybrid sensor histidine kinase/response regulator [Nitrospirillum]|uniref:hybrid sensor histidine kinase/response regulator n=1 Tax=Nitrospirillum amazonense TaxID=28077 RepID=UPI001B3B8278|nr:ATP-binding protein [Nitrospirillum amazonense]MEC4589538.1 ATP-binding protein [Nitrospirillum amazonense]